MTDAKPNAVGFYIRLYPEKWLTLFEGHSDRDKATLIDLLLRMARDGEALNYDPKRLARAIARKEKALSASLEVLEKEGAIIRGNGKISNHLMEVEFDFRRQKSVDGQKAANKRHGKNQMETSAVVMRSHSGGNAISEKESEIELEPTASSLDDGDEAEPRMPRAGSQDYAILPHWRATDFTIVWDGIPNNVRECELKELILRTGNKVFKSTPNWLERFKAFNPKSRSIKDLISIASNDGASVVHAMSFIVARAPSPIMSWAYFNKGLETAMKELDDGNTGWNQDVVRGALEADGTLSE
jgi:hypothetical protein